ncbi:MAG TPA: YkvA family protein [Rhodanobacteraceae bacterium]|nr:YkvA family protein [Rhodanobacteraceae bacterium]
MRIVLELEATDLQHFEQAMERANHAVRHVDEHEIVEAAKHALDHLPLANVPAYVRQRLQQVQRLLAMIEDDAWALPMPERGQVLRALAYVADPDDLVPDHIEVIGLLDDAIVLELLLRDQRHLLDAWRDFCASRDALGTAQHPAIRLRHAGRLARRREALLERMRRRATRA